MKKQPLVSIILPTHNREKYIKKAIESVWVQTYKNIELIIIDDGSTDKTHEIISELSEKNPKIIILTNKTNLGIVRALNKGIKIAQGKYIARLDDDDFWCNERKLEKQVDFLEKNSAYALVGGGVIRVDKQGKEIVRYLLPENDEDIRKVILLNNTFAHITTFFRRDMFEKVGGYDEQFVFSEDWDLWMKIGRLAKFYNFQEYFACYSGHERNQGIRKQIRVNLKLRKKYRNDYKGYKKAFLSCWMAYFYSFLPFKKKLWSITFKIRKLIFGPPPYKYFRKNSINMQIIIKSKKGLTGLNLKEVWQYRELFYFLSWRDVKVRYKQTVLGIAWAVIQPFIMMVVFTVVFGKLANMPSDNIPYAIFVYAGLLLWNIFSSSLNNASQSLVNSANIIQKVYLPRIIIPAASIIVALIDFLFAALVFGGIMFYYKFTPNFEGLILLPLLLLITITASLGLGSFLAALNVKYRDVRYVLPFFIQLLIYVTPVIYPISIIPKSYQWILALNPMTGVIESFKAGFLGTMPIDWVTLGISAVTSVIFLVFGLWYFFRTEKIFADII